MGNSHISKNIRFHISSKAFSGSFILNFDPDIIYQIENEIDTFVDTRTKKIQKDSLLIQKCNDGYEINVKAFIAICNIIFTIIKKYS